MREKGSKLLDVMVYSINYVLISYALSNVSMALKSSPVFILFFASELWVIGLYIKRFMRLQEAGSLQESCWYPVLPSILPWRIFSGGSSGTLFRLRYEG